MSLLSHALDDLSLFELLLRVHASERGTFNDEFPGESEPAALVAAMDAVTVLDRQILRARWRHARRVRYEREPGAPLPFRPKN